ncbi:ead/Ea22-like family protein [Citrobacter freundii]|uniref:ead/Ea22-like family protein n=1 Tax=Citrobacter freundii TaxID=546 RepID=UPI0016442A04|nr:ead/Ea22-like family protein [Citrobacter freundii]HBV7902558.1 ead/Ea22-like family protein [Citrobacter freundii]
MTALNIQAELRQLAEKATQGEWWSDVVETDGEYGEGENRASGYHSYAVYVGSESLLDMTNSTAACIHEEWDHDYHIAWDETAKRNAEFIAAANPPTVLALLDELDAAENNLIDSECHVAELEESLRDKQALLESAEKRIAEHNFENRLLANADRDIKALRQRIAELEARQPYGYLRENDGQIQISIGSNRPHDRSGGYATPWFAIYTAAGIGVKGE